MNEQLSWMDLAKQKRRSQYSPVILVDSNDPRRVAQVQLYALKVGFNGPHSKDRVYDFSEWRGLAALALTPEGGVMPEKQSRKDDLVSKLTGGGDELKTVDEALLEDSTTVIVHDVVNPGKDLLAAINAWSANGQLLTNGSTIVAFLADGFLPDNVRMKCNLVKPPISTQQEREEILESLEEAALEAKAIKKGLSKDQRQAIVNATGGLDLNQLEGKLAETINAGKPFDLIAIKEAKAELFSAIGLRVVEGWPYGFESVGGYGMLKEFVQKEVVLPLRMRNRAVKYGIKAAKGMIMFGPPGTGKTYFAKALSNEVGIPMVMISAADIFSKYVGESEQRTRAILERVQAMAPAILFIDEIDQLSTGRGSQGDGDSGTSRRVLNMTLSWLGDQQDVFVVGTTNVVDQIDSAFLRSGRFDLIAPMDFPDPAAREQIFRVQCEVIRKPPIAALDYVALAGRTNLATGADIEEIVIKAAKAAMIEDKPLGMEQFEEVLSNYSIPVDARKKQRVSMLRSVSEVLRDRRWAELLQRDVDENVTAASRVRFTAPEGGA